MIYNTDYFKLVLARSREIINLMNYEVDIGFVGRDLCYEYEYNGNILLDTGLIPNSTVLVSNNISSYEKNICSQYPKFAKKLLKNDNIFRISGSAEAYLSLNIFNECVDSYQTGNTIWANGLTVKKVLAKSSLVMLGDKKIEESHFYHQFIHYLVGKREIP